MLLYFTRFDSKLLLFRAEKFDLRRTLTRLDRRLPCPGGDNSWIARADTRRYISDAVNLWYDACWLNFDGTWKKMLLKFV